MNARPVGTHRRRGSAGQVTGAADVFDLAAPADTEDSAQLPWDTEPTTIADDVRAHAVKLATLREELAQREADVKAKRAAFDATITVELNSLAALRREVEAEEGAVRGFALLAHDQTGNPKVCAGVEVVKRKEYDIDEPAAFAWAKEKGLCLIPESLDVKALQRLAANTNTPLPFVTITETPSVRIASNLLEKLSGAA